MRPTARRFAENWLDERVVAREVVSAKDWADALVRDGGAEGIAAEDFDDDGCFFEMVVAAIDRRRPS